MAFQSLGKEAKKTWDTTKREWDAVTGVGSKLLEWDKSTSINSKWVPFAKKGSAYPPGEDPMGSDYSRRQFYNKDYWSGLGREEGALSAARLMREGMVPAFAAPGVTETMTHGTGVASDKTAAVNVEGEVNGTVEGTFKVEAGSELLRVYEETKHLSADLRGMIRTLGSNGVATTGKSSPDAAAPSVPHVGSVGNSPL